MRRLNNRGIVLIGSYIVVALLMVYSSGMMIRTMNQNLVTIRLQERAQAMSLAQGAMEQLREDFYMYFSRQVYQIEENSNAVAALQWLDGYLPLSGAVMGPFSSMDFGGSAVLNSVPGVSGQGIDSNAINAHRSITLSSMPNSAGEAWITGILREVDLNNNGEVDPVEDLNGNGTLDTGALAPRFLVIESTAQVGDTIKRIRATYQIGLAPSKIFKYAYFVNNYGWMEVNDDQGNADPNKINIRGDMGSNGDLWIGGDKVEWLNIEGDINASINANLRKINDPSRSMDGSIIIESDDGATPSALTQLEYWGERDSLDEIDYFHNGSARPTMDLTLENQPIIGTDNQFPDGYDSNYPTAASPDQHQNEGKPTQDIPYLGDLDLYRTAAADSQAALPAGEFSLKYYEQTWNVATQAWDAATEYTHITNGVRTSTEPLVLVGTFDNPIVINGPVVIDSDVIIKGYVTGRGTIYTGRNVHIVGSIQYRNPPQWRSLERDPLSGKVRDAYDHSDRGKVCAANNTYIAAGDTSSCP